MSKKITDVLGTWRGAWAFGPRDEETAWLVNEVASWKNYGPLDDALRAAAAADPNKRPSAASILAEARRRHSISKPSETQACKTCIGGFVQASKPSQTVHLELVPCPECRNGTYRMWSKGHYAPNASHNVELENDRAAFAGLNQ